ncbi:MAG: DinB family protein [Saprospiraceae bacterium]|nr:DinB family protein [Saprospiraceae bacterium]
MISKLTINPMPEYFDRYSNLVEADNLLNAFSHSHKTIMDIDICSLKNIGLKTYAQNKWTVNEIIQHIIDTEHIFCYRALCFARKDTTPLPGFDENLFAEGSFANSRSLTDIIDEFKTLRISTFQLFKSFDGSVLENTGVCFDKIISVTSIGFVIIGHQNHHFKIIKEKYEPLI